MIISTGINYSKKVAMETVRTIQTAKPVGVGMNWLSCDIRWTSKGSFLQYLAAKIYKHLSIGHSTRVFTFVTCTSSLVDTQTNELKTNWIKLESNELLKAADSYTQRIEKSDLCLLDISGIPSVASAFFIISLAQTSNVHAAFSAFSQSAASRSASSDTLGIQELTRIERAA